MFKYGNFAVLLCLFIYTQVRGATGDEHWDYGFDVPGVDSSVVALHTSGTNIYAAGADNPSNKAAIHQWDGRQWSVIGTAAGSTSNSFVFVQAIASRNDTLLVSGTFTSMNGVPCRGLALWNRTNWTSIGSVTGLVYSIYVDGADVYCGGYFTSVGGIAATNLARWDGANWHPVGGGVSGGIGNVPIASITKTGNRLYVAGDFKKAGGVSVNNIAAWNGASWEALGNGLYGGVQVFGNPFVGALATDGTTLYAGGTFRNAGTVSANYIARWNGTTWSALGVGVNTNVHAICVKSAGEVFVGGEFGTAGGNPSPGIARWNGSAWSAIGGPNNSVNEICLQGTNVILGGLFYSVGGLLANGVARWDGVNWSGIGHPSYTKGLGVFPRVLQSGTNGLYAGGIFAAAGSSRASKIARFDGTNWHALGAGIKGTNASTGADVKAIAVDGPTVYIGGIFTNAGTAAANNFARWNGTAWDTMGLTFNDEVRAIAVNGDDMYVGGFFTSSSSGAVGRILKYSGGVVSTMGGGMNGNVLAIATSGNTVYAGGSFTTAAGVIVDRIAMWNGIGWGPLGFGVSGGSVNAIAIDGSDVYVGGSFTFVDGMAGFGRIAKWNGSSWSSLGTGANSTITSMAFRNGKLYVCGSFSMIGGVPANRVARWNGAAWEALGSGFYSVSSSASPTSLAFHGDDLFAAGLMDRAGTRISRNLARWNENKNFDPPAMSLNSVGRLLNGDLQFRISGTGHHSYALEGSDDLRLWIPIWTNHVPDVDFVQTPTSEKRFYRTIWLP